MDIRKDKSFVKLLIAERAQMLARIYAIEEFLEMPSTKVLLRTAKEERSAAKRDHKEPNKV